MGQKNRILWLDALKGLTIILVIVGHGPVIDEHIGIFINSFHMPLFFCIAGYTFTRQDNFRKFAEKKFHRLMKPYFFTVGILLICAEFLQIKSTGKIAGGKVAARWIWAGIYGSCWSYEQPFLIYDIGAIWFLCALFCALIIFNHILYLDENKIPFFVIILAYIGIETKSYIWLPWGLQSGLAALVFLYAGFLAKENGWLEKKIPFCAHMVMFSVSMICICKQSMAICGNNTYTYGWITIIGAVFISFYVTKILQFLCSHMQIVGKIFSFYGENSLVILCFHLVELDFVPWTSYIHIFSEERLDHAAILGCKLIFALVVVFVKNKTYLRKIYG